MGASRGGEIGFKSGLTHPRPGRWSKGQNANCDVIALAFQID
jgi:hypothetical protein